MFWKFTHRAMNGKKSINLGDHGAPSAPNDGEGPGIAIRMQANTFHWSSTPTSLSGWPTFPTRILPLEGRSWSAGLTDARSPPTEERGWLSNLSASQACRPFGAVWMELLGSQFVVAPLRSSAGGPEAPLRLRARLQGDSFHIDTTLRCLTPCLNSTRLSLVWRPTDVFTVGTTLSLHLRCFMVYCQSNYWLASTLPDLQNIVWY